MPAASSATQLNPATASTEGPEPPMAAGDGDAAAAGAAIAAAASTAATAASTLPMSLPLSILGRQANPPK